VNVPAKVPGPAALVNVPVTVDVSFPGAEALAAAGVAERAVAAEAAPAVRGTPTARASVAVVAAVAASRRVRDRFISVPFFSRRVTGPAN
jgi:hypothetical protein